MADKINNMKFTTDEIISVAYSMLGDRINEVNNKDEDGFFNIVKQYKKYVKECKKIIIKKKLLLLCENL